ncbi:MAG: TIGR00725 family protein [Snowella sp.]|nr:TIGR00725 family protein [Snowella sp.]
MKNIIVGVMGPGESATPIDLENAYQLGKLIAQAHWILLTGGRSSGVMEAANQGAKSEQGLTLGILPNNSLNGASDSVDIAILTDVGQARNNINVLTSHIVIACGMGLGTASEVALALKQGKFVILLTQNSLAQQFFSELAPNQVYIATDPPAAIAYINRFLKPDHHSSKKN